MNLNLLDRHVATREAGATARGAAHWNGQPLDRCWLRHGELARGGVLEFQMSEHAGAWGRSRLPGETT